MYNFFFIQPFEITYRKLSKFFSVAIEGNRVYKSFSVWVDETADGFVKINLLALCNDGKKELYVNNIEEYDRIKQNIANTDLSQVFFAPIKLLRRESRLFTHIKVFFRNQRYELIEIFINTLKRVSNKRKAIERKKNVLNKDMCSIVYTSKIMRPSAKSYVSIVGRDYSIKKRKSSLLSPRHLMISCVNNLGVMGIVNSKRTLVPVRMPDGLYEGAKFIYESNGKEITYTIERLKDKNQFTIVHANERIEAVENDGNISIKRIFITAHPEAPILKFDPPIKLHSSEEIEISEHSMQLVMGTSVEYCNLTLKSYSDRGFIISITNQNFEWTKQFPMVFSVVRGEEELTLSSGIMKDDRQAELDKPEE